MIVKLVKTVFFLLLLLVLPFVIIIPHVEKQHAYVTVAKKKTGIVQVASICQGRAGALGMRVTVPFWSSQMDRRKCSGQMFAFSQSVWPY